ncbi:MAG: hypothetical protein HY704_14745 [Gemmatimonadetes bacterium]|nr:hypothetical protein [Gemmatimonadota bacterium]
MSKFTTQMTPQELGDTLARLVWESFSDFIADGEADALFADVGIKDPASDQRIVEEMLIFLMWAHTRAAQLAFVSRVPSELLREGLDAMHRGVFEDMAEHGTPRSHLPVFEQRVSARYAEYYAAADRNDAEVGTAALRHLVGSRDVPPHLPLALAERAIAVAGPLRDFLEDVELVE